MTLALRRCLGSTPLEEPEGTLRRYRTVLGESRASQLNIDRALANAFDDSREVEFDDFIKRINDLPRLTAGEKSLVDGVMVDGFHWDVSRSQTWATERMVTPPAGRERLG